MKWYEAKGINASLLNGGIGNPKETHGMRVFKNDDNLKPDWIEHAAQNTEFHIVRKKKSILVVIGESWTYGESLPNVATGIRKYSLESQIQHCFGPKLALALDKDYYQYAVPGNCNFYMASSVERIIEHLKKNYQYEKIDICIQMTEPSREHAIINKLIDPYSKIYDMTEIKTFDEWLIRYDEIFLDEFTRIKNKHNVEITIWKNFCPFQNKKKYEDLRLVQTTWIQLSGKMFGLELGHQRFQSIGWFDDFYNQFKKKINFDLTEINKEINNIERSNNFIKGNYLHNNHPTETGHSLWAMNLRNEYTK